MRRRETVTLTPYRHCAAANGCRAAESLTEDTDHTEGPTRRVRYYRRFYVFKTLRGFEHGVLAAAAANDPLPSGHLNGEFSKS